MPDFSSFIRAARDYGTSNAPLELSQHEAPARTRSDSTASTSSLDSAGQPLLQERLTQSTGRFGKFVAALRNFFGVYSTPQRLAAQQFIESARERGGPNDQGLINQILRREGVREGRGITPQQILKVNASIAAQATLNSFINDEVDLRQINQPGSIIHDIAQEILQEIKDTNDAILQKPGIAPDDKRRQIAIHPESNEIGVNYSSGRQSALPLTDVLLVAPSGVGQDGNATHYDEAFNDTFYRGIEPYVAQFEQRSADLSASPASLRQEFKREIGPLIKASLKPVIENAIYKHYAARYDAAASPIQGLEVGHLLGEEATKATLTDLDLRLSDLKEAGLAEDFNGLLRGEIAYRNQISRSPIDSSGEAFAVRNGHEVDQIVRKLVERVDPANPVQYSQPLEKLANWNREILNARAELKNQLASANTADEVQQVRTNFEAKRAELTQRLADYQQQIPGNLPELRLRFEFSREVEHAINQRQVQLSRNGGARPAPAVRTQHTAVASAFAGGATRARAAQPANPLSVQNQKDALAFNGDFESVSFTELTPEEQNDVQNRFLDIQNDALAKAYADTGRTSPLDNGPGRNRALINQVHARLTPQEKESFKNEFLRSSQQVYDRVSAAGPSRSQREDLQNIAIDLLARKYAQHLE